MSSVSQVFGKWRGAARSALLFVRREPGSALLLARMAAWVAALSLLVKVLPLPRVLELITPRRRRPRVEDSAEIQAGLARLLDLLLAADVWIFTPTCWKRAPVLYRYLALNGIESRIMFGLRKPGENVLDGHAWLEAGGRPLLEKTAADYRVTFSYPA